MKSNLLHELLFSLPIIAIVLQMMLNNNKLTLAKITNLAISFLFLILSVIIFIEKQGLIVIQIADWPAPYGISLVFDSLTKLLLLVFAIITSCVSIYSFQDHTLSKNVNSFYTGMWLMVIGIIGALATFDIFNLYVWSEVMLVSAFIFLTLNFSNNTKKIYQYAVFNILATLLMLLAIALIYGITGSLNYAAIAQYLNQNQHNLIWPSIVLFILSLSIKGGVFPFYFWLPNAYPNMNSSSILLLSSMVTKVIMVVILKLVWLWIPISYMPIKSFFIFLACCTMFFGVMGAATNFKIKDILSFHIVSQIGYILLATFIQTPLAIVAAIYFLIHNIFVKTSLLMTASIVKEQYHSDELVVLGQITKACPMLAGVFFISAMSLAGFPPFSGFWGKLLVFKVILTQRHFIALFFAILVSLFTLYSMIKIWRYAYCEKVDGMSVIKFKLSFSQLSSLLPLVLISLLIGLYPQGLLSMLNQVANEMSQPQAMITAVLGEKS